MLNEDIPLPEKLIGIPTLFLMRLLGHFWYSNRNETCSKMIEPLISFKRKKQDIIFKSRFALLPYKVNKKYGNRKAKQIKCY